MSVPLTSIQKPPPSRLFLAKRAPKLRWTCAMSLGCLLWKSNPFYWQTVVGLQAAKSAGAISDRDECERFVKRGGEAALAFKIPPLISGSLGTCACEAVFDDAGNTPVWHGWFP